MSAPVEDDELACGGVILFVEAGKFPFCVLPSGGMRCWSSADRKKEEVAEERYLISASPSSRCTFHLLLVVCRDYTQQSRLLC